MNSVGQIRRSQLITTFGPGALIDLPKDSAIVGGLDVWPEEGKLEEIQEPRLARKIAALMKMSAVRLYAPPASSDDPRAMKPVVVFRFPEWFLVQEKGPRDERVLSRRLVHRKVLDRNNQFDGLPTVAIRFVRACPRGHVDDIDWYGYVHGQGDPCKGQLWLDERGISGGLGDLVVRCASCGKSRNLQEASKLELNPLGTCRGARPWLGPGGAEGCNQPSRLLNRTASNAYFPQVMSVLSLPDRSSKVDEVVREFWEYLQIVDGPAELAVLKKKPRISERLLPFSDSEVLEVIRRAKEGVGGDRPIKEVELEAILAAPEGFGEDVPVNPDFHARRLPDRCWRQPGEFDGIDAVIQLHRLREVTTLIGFTRLEAELPDLQGEYETDVQRASIASEPSWFPAVENRGEGIFLQFRTQAVRTWLERPGVRRRLESLMRGHQRWTDGRRSKRLFPGGPYILLHSLSHVLIQSLAMRCGYPASSIRERIYVDLKGDRYGLLLYTSSSDAEGTLGGLVHQGRYMAGHLRQALRSSELCSNDPICAHHAPGESLEGRWLLGAACHGCLLVAETSCEMRNDYLDRALLVPVIGLTDAAFFESAG
ncbi:MAG TPA: DUF1998 domain-containing protein [Planctomycetota bacterium]|jgi:hypothetical protein|nr:DUF1998 domain-containing protein [Planctomycetota bacterium]